MKSYGALAARIVRALLYVETDDETIERVPFFLPNDPRQFKYTCLVWIYIALRNPLHIKSGRKIFGLFFAQRYIFSSIEHKDKKYSRRIRQICLASLVRGREDIFVVNPWYKVDKTDGLTSLVRDRENRFVSRPWYEVDKTNLSRILGTG